MSTSLADRVAMAMSQGGHTLAVAESLTGGELCATLVAVPGISAVLRGGVVAYATDLKSTLLGVEVELLAEHGPVHPDVALQMARGAAGRLDADHGIATTGVAGPGPADGHPAGTVHIAAHGPRGASVRSWHLAGPRPVLRRAASTAALALLLSVLEPGRSGGTERAQPALD